MHSFTVFALPLVFRSKFAHKQLTHGAGQRTPFPEPPPMVIVVANPPTYSLGRRTNRKCTGNKMAHLLAIVSWLAFRDVLVCPRCKFSLWQPPLTPLLAPSVACLPNAKHHHNNYGKNRRCQHTHTHTRGFLG